MNKSFTVLTAGILLGACGTSTAPAPEPDTQVVESFTPGTPVPPKAGMQVEEVSAAPEQASEYTKYEGTLPAADAAGIKTTLILFENGRFALDEAYIGVTLLLPRWALIRAKGILLRCNRKKTPRATISWAPTPPPCWTRIKSLCKGNWRRITP